MWRRIRPFGIKSKVGLLGWFIECLRLANLLNCAELVEYESFPHTDGTGKSTRAFGLPVGESLLEGNP